MPTPTLLSSSPRVWPRLKLIWRSSDVVQGRWWLGLFCSYERRPGFPGTGLAISLRGVLRWTLVLSVAGYLTGAAVIARWFAHSPHNQIGFSDVLTWPVRRTHVAQLRGRAWLAQGKDALQAKRWAEGAFLLRRGLELCPEDFEARFTMAQFYLLSGQRTRALALLIDGALRQLPPPAWREQVFTLTAAGEDWESTLLFCDRCLPRVGEPAKWAERQTLLAHKLVALIALDRAGEALTLAEGEGDPAAVAVKAQRVRALLALGRPGDAAEFIRRWRAVMLVDMWPEIARLQVQALREAGRLDEMDRTLAELRSLHSERPEPLAFAVEQKARTGRGAAAALDDYLFRFGNTPANLQLLGQPLSEIPDVVLLQHIVAAAAEHGFPTRPLRVHLAVALLRSGDWPALARLVGELAPAFAKADSDGKLWFNWIQSLSAALSSPTPGPTEHLLAFLQTRKVSLEAHRLTVTALRRAGLDPAARSALAIARMLYSESPWLRAQQADVERAIAAAPAPLSAPAPLPPVVAAGWREFFQSIDEAVGAGRWPDAQQSLTTVRRARPAPIWLAAHEAEFNWREIRVAQGLHAAPALRLSLRLYLNGSAERAAEVLKFARELRADAPDDALTLVKAVLEKSPDHPMATTLFAEWRPRARP